MTLPIATTPPTPSAPMTLISQSGSDDYNSPSFTVNSGTVTATYSYSNCADGSSNFIADMQTPNQS
jgi:hypothetical protein